ncbi:MAG TPA: VOC family protein [Woeseiaceae bacterium]|nr:VOC family protein [Woeseiaceae bacterium]
MKVIVNVVASVAIATIAFLIPSVTAGGKAPPSIDSQIIMLYYDEISDAAHFYEHVLNLPKTLDEEWVKIYQVTDSSSVGVVKAGRGAYHATQERNAVMLSLVTTDVDGWYRRLRQNDRVSFLKDIRDSENVPIRSFLVEDPGGYTVEFFQWLNAD